MNRFVKNNLVLFIVLGVSVVVALALLVWTAIRYTQMTRYINETDKLRKQIGELIAKTPAPVDDNKPRISADIDLYSKTAAGLQKRFGHPLDPAVDAFIKELKLTAKEAKAEDAPKEITLAWLKEKFPKGFDALMTGEYVRSLETSAYLGIPHAKWQKSLYLRPRDMGNLQRFCFDEHYTREEAEQLLELVLHREYAPDNHRTLCVYGDIALEHLGKTPVHPARYLPVLLGAERRQLTKTPLGFLLQQARAAQDVGSQRRQLAHTVGPGKHFYRHVVLVLAYQVPRAVAPVVADIERTVALRRGREALLRRSGIGKVVAARQAFIFRNLLLYLLAGNSKRNRQGQHKCKQFVHNIAIEMLKLIQR